MSSPKAPKVATKATAKRGAKGRAATAVRAIRKPAGKKAVEVLRRIPAPHKIVENDASIRATALAREIEQALREGDLEKFQPAAQQALIAAVCRLYGAHHDTGSGFPAIGQPSAVSATDAMILCSSLLKAVDLQVFELGLWQSWSAR